MLIFKENSNLALEKLFRNGDAPSSNVLFLYISPPPRPQIELDAAFTCSCGPQTAFLQVIATGPPDFDCFWLKKNPQDDPSPFDLRIVFHHTGTPHYYKPIPQVTIKPGHPTLMGWAEFPTKLGGIIRAPTTADNFNILNLQAPATVETLFEIKEIDTLVAQLSSAHSKTLVTQGSKYQLEIKSYQESQTTLETKLSKLQMDEADLTKLKDRCTTLEREHKLMKKHKESWKSDAENYKERALQAEAAFKIAEDSLSKMRDDLAAAEEAKKKADEHKCPPTLNMRDFQNLKKDLRAVEVTSERYRKERNEAERERDRLRTMANNPRNNPRDHPRDGPGRDSDWNPKIQRLDIAGQAPTVAATVSNELTRAREELAKEREDLAREKELSEKMRSSLDTFRDSIKTEIALNIREQLRQPREREPPPFYDRFDRRPFF